MAIRLTRIPTDESMRETTAHGASDFPFEYYIDDIRQFTNHAVEWHWHSEIEWIYAGSGTVNCGIGSEQIVLRTGCGMFINSRVIHHFESRDGAVMPNVLFLPSFIAEESSAVYKEWVAPVLQSGCSFVPLDPEEKRGADTLELLRQLFALADEKPRDLLQIQIGTALLWRQFVREYASCFGKGGNPKDMLLQSRIRRMLQYVQEHYAEKLTLEQIAQSASISRSEALRCFHSALRQTPVDYLIGYRLLKARQLLTTTNDSVSGIAAAVGMENISYFIRAFKARYGKTPGAYRREATHAAGKP